MNSPTELVKMFQYKFPRKCRGGAMVKFVRRNKRGAHFEIYATIAFGLRQWGAPDDVLADNKQDLIRWGMAKSTLAEIWKRK